MSSRWRSGGRRWGSGMNDVQLRRGAGTRKFASSKELIQYCRQIDQGWYRCQALASGAKQLDQQESLKACKAAISAAKTEKDEYRRLTPVVWVIETLADMGHRKFAEELTDRIISCSHQVIPSNSEAYMLELLFDHAENISPQYRRDIFMKLMTLLDTKPGWRIGRACIHTAHILDEMGESESVNCCMERCTNEWLVGRVRRDRARDN